MADRRISDLTPRPNVTGDEIIPLARGAQNFSTTISDISDFTLSNFSVDIPDLQQVTQEGANTNVSVTFDGGGSFTINGNGLVVDSNTGNITLGSTGPVLITGAAGSQVNIGTGTSGNVVIGGETNSVLSDRPMQLVGSGFFGYTPIPFDQSPGPEDSFGGLVVFGEDDLAPTGLISIVSSEGVGIFTPGGPSISVGNENIQIGGSVIAGSIQATELRNRENFALTLRGEEGLTLLTDFEGTQWIFSPTGNLTLPPGGDILDNNGFSVLGSDVDLGNFEISDFGITDIFTNSGKSFFVGYGSDTSGTGDFVFTGSRQDIEDFVTGPRNVFASGIAEPDILDVDLNEVSINIQSVTATVDQITVDFEFAAVPIKDFFNNLYRPSRSNDRSVLLNGEFVVRPTVTGTDIMMIEVLKEWNITEVTELVLTVKNTKGMVVDSGRSDVILGQRDSNWRTLIDSGDDVRINAGEGVRATAEEEIRLNAGSFTRIDSGTFTTIESETTTRIDSGTTVRIRTNKNAGAFSDRNDWTFQQDGTLQFPDGTVQSTAFDSSLAADTGAFSAGEIDEFGQTVATWSTAEPDFFIGGLGHTVPEAENAIESGMFKFLLPLLPGDTVLEGQTGLLHQDLTPAVEFDSNDWSSATVSDDGIGNPRIVISGPSSELLLFLDQNLGSKPLSRIRVNGESGAIFDDANYNSENDEITLEFTDLPGVGDGVTEIDLTALELQFVNSLGQFIIGDNFEGDKLFQFNDVNGGYGFDVNVEQTVRLNSQSDRVLITSQGLTWQFDTAGLTFPDGTTQATAITTGIPSDINQLSDTDGLLFDGDYGSLANTPVIPADLGDLTDTGNLLFDGSYNSLTDTPAIPADLGDLTDTGGLLFDGNYNSLTNKPDLSALEEVFSFDSLEDFPEEGEANKVYIAEDTGLVYRWAGGVAADYVVLSDQTAIWGQISGTVTDQNDLVTLIDTTSANAVNTFANTLSAVATTGDFADLINSANVSFDRVTTGILAGTGSPSGVLFTPSPDDVPAVSMEKHVFDFENGKSGFTIRSLVNPTEVKFDTNVSNLNTNDVGAIFGVRSSGNAVRLWVGQGITSTGRNDFYVGELSNHPNLPWKGANIRLLAESGEGRFTGEVFAFFSDERLKNFEGKIEGALDKVNQLNGYYFTENDLARSMGYKNEKRQVGVSAQEVEAVLPEVVAPAPVDDEYKTVKYEKMVPLLIEAIKELTQQNAQLMERIEKLEKR